jgi:hypothetical protein
VGQAITDHVAGRFAAGSLACTALGQAKYEDVLKIVDRVPKNTTNDEYLGHYRREALHALGRFAEVLADRSMNTSVGEMDMVQFHERLYYTCRKDGAAGADVLIAEFLQPWKQMSDQVADAVETEGRLKEFVAYVCGDDKPLAAHGKTSEKAGLQTRLAAGMFDKIDDAVADTQNPAPGEANLMVAIAATLAGKLDVADRQIAAASGAMAKGDDDHRALGEWLAGKVRPNVQAATRLNLSHEEKRIALTVLGQRYPEIREECFALAKKLNFDRHPPYLILSKALKQEAEKSEP